MAENIPPEVAAYLQSTGQQLGPVAGTATPVPQVPAPQIATPALPQSAGQAALDGYYAASAKNLDAQSALAQAQSDKIAAGPGLMEYGQLGLQGLGAITNVMSYFDNKKTQKLQREGLKTNIANAKQTQANTQSFIGGTKSAFA